MSIDDPYTPAELFVLARVRDEALWWHTATIQATMLNIMGAKKSAKDLHPHYAKREKPKTIGHREMVAILRRQQANGNKSG